MEGRELTKEGGFAQVRRKAIGGVRCFKREKESYVLSLSVVDII